MTSTALPLALLALASPQDTADDPTVLATPRIVAIVRHERDRAEPALFRELARRADAEALSGLQECATLVFQPDALESVYGAAARLRDVGPLRERVRAWLLGEVTGERWLAHHPAARALATFGGSAERELRSLVETHPDPVCRAIAVGGLLTALRAQGDRAALELLLENFRPPHSGPREAGVRTLRGFRDEEHVRRMERGVRDGDLPPAIRTMIVEALVAQGGARVREVLVDALQERDVAIQLAALRGLATCGTPDDARAVERRLRADEPALRRAALVTLGTLRRGEPAWAEEYAEYVDHRDVALRLGALELLVDDPAAVDLDLLLRFAEDEDPLVRRRAATALGRVRDVRVIPTLLDRLAGDPLRVREAARAALVQLTGLDLGRGATRWHAWWRAEGAAYVLPPPEEVARRIALRAERQEAGATAVSFYGVPLGSDCVAFVVDTSGSMDTRTAAGRPRLEAVVEELVATLEAFPPEGRFNLVFFSDKVRRWRKKLVDRDEKSLGRAVGYARAQRAVGGTAIHDALVAALEDEEVDTIVLLTDGEPTEGRLQDPEEILADIELRNELRQVVIHCVSVSRESGLLSALAAQTGGAYHEVD